jgi:hypothetical protein
MVRSRKNFISCALAISGIMEITRTLDDRSDDVVGTADAVAPEIETLHGLQGDLSEQNNARKLVEDEMKEVIRGMNMGKTGAEDMENRQDRTNLESGATKDSKETLNPLPPTHAEHVEEVLRDTSQSDHFTETRGGKDFEQEDLEDRTQEYLEYIEESIQEAEGRLGRYDQRLEFMQQLINRHENAIEILNSVSSKGELPPENAQAIERRRALIERNRANIKRFEDNRARVEKSIKELEEWREELLEEEEDRDKGGEEGEEEGERELTDDGEEDKEKKTPGGRESTMSRQEAYQKILKDCHAYLVQEQERREAWQARLKVYKEIISSIISERENAEDGIIPEEAKAKFIQQCQTFDNNPEFAQDAEVYSGKVTPMDSGASSFEPGLATNGRELVEAWCKKSKTDLTDQLQDINNKLEAGASDPLKNNIENMKRRIEANDKQIEASHQEDKRDQASQIDQPPSKNMDVITPEEPPQNMPI